MDALEQLLEDIHFPRHLGATVAAARGLAAAVDRQPSNSGLWRAYQAAVRELTACPNADSDAELERALAQIRAAAPDFTPESER